MPPVPTVGEAGAGIYWERSGADEPLLLIQGMSGTRLTWEHTGFQGVEGSFMAALLGRVRRKMLSKGLPAVLDDLARP